MTKALLALLILLAPGGSATITLTGYLTDSHCGRKGAARTHTAQCIATCMKGGARPQLLNEADNRLYTLDGIDKVKELVGVRVTLKGTLDADGTKLTVASAEKAPSAESP